MEINGDNFHKLVPFGVGNFVTGHEISGRLISIIHSGVDSCSAFCCGEDQRCKPSWLPKNIIAGVCASYRNQPWGIMVDHAADRTMVTNVSNAGWSCVIQPATWHHLCLAASIRKNTWIGCNVLVQWVGNDVWWRIVFPRLASSGVEKKVGSEVGNYRSGTSLRNTKSSSDNRTAAHTRCFLFRLQLCSYWHCGWLGSFSDR